MILLVTADEAIRINDLAHRCEHRFDEFDEEQWEAGLRLILGEKRVEEMKQHNVSRLIQGLPTEKFALKVGEWISR